tara:strand:+ start:646 stop:1923 length:1278 start_codon:yes stop_codon:yes gene_type:complete
VIRVVHSFSENASLEAIDLSSVDLFWTEPLEFRYRAFAALRQQDPIRFFAEPEIEGLPPGAGYWALTRHADVVEASRRTDAFCSGKGTNIPDLPPAFLEFYGSMINLDDPRHARLRRLVSGGFTPRMMRELDIGIDVTTTEIVDAAAEKGSCDFVVDVAARLPLAIICDLMGIEAERRDEVFELSNVVLSQGDPEYVPEGVDPLVAFLEAGAGLAEIMKDTAELRRGGNGEDLTSVLVNAEVDGERLTEDELASFFVLLCVAGNETTRNATAWGLQLLTENPEQRDRWLADLDGVLPTAVEEIVRMSSPVIHFRRTVTSDGVRLGGHEFSEGDKVVLFYASANRDETVFVDPECFDVTREPNPHVGFGGPGPHFCLGAHLARRQVGAMFRELLSRFPEVRSTAEPDRLRSNFVNGIKHLPCSLTA